MHSAVSKAIVLSLNLMYRLLVMLLVTSVVVLVTADWSPRLLTWTKTTDSSVRYVITNLDKVFNSKDGNPCKKMGVSLKSVGSKSSAGKGFFS